MRKIIDANYLKDDALYKYLTASSNNYAVLTDYAAMEAYKGDKKNTLESILNSMCILCQFPKQVIILKGTTNICALSKKSKGLIKRFIDKGQTKGFTKYCNSLKDAEKGNKKLEQVILKLGADANEHMENILKDSKNIINSISEISKKYSKDELRIFRKREPYTIELARKIIKQIIIVSDLLHSNHPKNLVSPNDTDLSNSFIFRFSLCMYLLTLDWISNGGAVGVKPERMRNDLVDMNYVAYATFFDGIMTNDNKATKIYYESKYVLERIFVA